MKHLEKLFNGLLVGASGYAMYCIQPTTNPYAFSACAFGLCHGLLGLISSFKDDDECTTVRLVSCSIMQIVPLPLINIELYLMSESSSALAMGHGLFVIPLAFDLIAKLFTEDREDSSTETLKDLTILGNIVSLIFLSVNEDNYAYALIASLAFMSKYGAMAIDSFFEGSQENISLLSLSGIFALLPAAMTKA